MDSTTLGADSHSHTSTVDTGTDNEAAIIEVCAGAQDLEDWKRLMDQLNLSTDPLLLVQIRNGLRHKRRGIHGQG